ncbi:MAG TPA: diguanylate cyclase [Gemmatimonadales bacterium]|jgi:diguanylate cyclase (GGDEF)-like protein|nr:diguanylate cyclase [Gemmatimonadales bacterium]
MFAVVATLLPSLTTVWISYIENKRALTAKASEELLGVSAQAVREVDLWTKELRYDLRVFSISYEVTENLERLPQVNGERTRAGIYFNRLTDYLNSVRARFPNYAELLVLDPHGHVVATTASQPRAVPLAPDWAEDLTRNDWALGAPYWDSTGTHAEMLVSVPIELGRRAGRRAGGTPLLGALASRVNLRSVADTLRQFAPGESGQIYLMTRTGRVIVSSRGSSRELMRQGFGRDIANWLAAREGRAVQFTSFTGDRVVGTVRAVPALDWLVVSEIPTAEAFRQVARLRNVTLGIVTLLLAVVGALAYLLSLLIVRPLNRLRQAADKVAKGDLDVGLSVTMGGEVGYLTEVFNDMVARLRESRTDLERLSVTDALTGLSNRLRMMEVLENEVRRSRRMRHPFAVVMADVDLFKRYNDDYGHPAGDIVLKRVAAIMREASRDVDFVARYGGEEFLIVMPETEIDGATEFAERIRKKLATEPLPAGQITLSLGVSAFPMHGDAPDQLIAEADAALYLAKRAGGDRVVAAARPSVPAA